MFVSGRLQHGLIRSLEAPLRELGRDSSGEKLSHIGVLNNQWRGIMRVGSLGEKIKSYRIELQFLICGLITTSIVSSLTPTTTTVIVPFSPEIPDGKVMPYISAENHPCVGFYPNSTRVDFKRYFWPFPNGTTIYSDISSAYCPSTKALILAPQINTVDPEHYAYIDAGTAVAPTAMGTPISILNGTAIKAVSNKYSVSLIKTEQCVPVMRTNPVRCEKGGSITVKTHSEFVLTLEDGSQSASISGYSRNFSRDSGMASASFRNYKAQFATNIVIGGYTDPAGDTPFASYIAQAVNDPDVEAGLGGSSTYAVTCSVDPTDVFEYRMVTLDTQAIGQGKGKEFNVAYYVSGGEICTPVSPSTSTVRLATVLTASDYFLNERQSLDGYMQTLLGLAGTNRGPPYAFNNSRNALEDVLGVSAAMAVSRIPMNGSVSADAFREKGGPARVTVKITRLGSDNSEILLLLIPPVLSLILLLYQFSMSFTLKLQPGGGRTGETLLGEQHPQQYAAENLEELLRLISWKARSKQVKNSGQWTDASLEDVSLEEMGSMIPLRRLGSEI
ncbi:uncharacterized protein ColSpa_06040 [Colletotrichum spaethianum]|uniref:Uncharacterized protein n=1 Tax=Colletotrichum spaethianum TaxID=700344 RepID=A0AA37P7V3_9PEZI|nr:uncharacterized protein ColSpa_06040 [Colletotrichum spaethianum]GKT45859.1 hypothetical protein ColSpa_06040 [Colletotrichum spaethianum]